MFAKIIKDSISREGIRLTTFHLRYWRAIHAELMTHRDFSRNARSSRAVPSRILLTEPIFTPQFGWNQGGMQAKEEAVPVEVQERWAKEWFALADMCRRQVEKWQQEGMHKQWANRPLEWFGWIDVLVSATHWNNFWELRISEYAQPEFNDLAILMKDAMATSQPKLLAPRQWHLPYITDRERSLHSIDYLLKLSTARCARLSYKPFDGADSEEAEIARYEKLVVSRPVHASPSEHQATPDFPSSGRYYYVAGRLHSRGWRSPHLHGNFEGWVQHRKMIPHEVVR
jgi:hypothetical protein